MEQKRLYTCKEAAALHEELTEYMVRKMISDGKLEPVRFGRNIYVTEDALHKAIYGEPAAPPKPTSRRGA